MAFLGDLSGLSECNERARERSYASLKDEESGAAGTTLPRYRHKHNPSDD